MVYPNRTHCIGEGAETSRHLRELLTRYLEAHLPAGPAAASPSPTSNRGAAAPPDPDAGAR